MQFLAVDTSTGVTSVAVMRDGEVVHVVHDDRKGTQAGALVGQMQACMHVADASWAALDGMVCCTGPGGFTSVRIGVSAVRGAALAANVASYGVPLMAVMAWDAFQHGHGMVTCALPVGRRDVACATYACREGVPIAVVAQRCVPVAELEAHDGAALVVLAGMEQAYMHAFDVRECAVVMARMVDTCGVQHWPAPAPLYARAPDAIAGAPLLS